MVSRHQTVGIFLADVCFLFFAGWIWHTHTANSTIYWLPAYGYILLLRDYRIASSWTTYLLLSISMFTLSKPTVFIGGIFLFLISSTAEARIKIESSDISPQQQLWFLNPNSHWWQLQHKKNVVWRNDLEMIERETFTNRALVSK